MHDAKIEPTNVQNRSDEFYDSINTTNWPSLQYYVVSLPTSYCEKLLVIKNSKVTDKKVSYNVRSGKNTP